MDKDDAERDPHDGRSTTTTVTTTGTSARGPEGARNGEVEQQPNAQPQDDRHGEHQAADNTTGGHGNTHFMAEARQATSTRRQRQGVTDQRNATATRHHMRQQRTRAPQVAQRDAKTGREAGEQGDKRPPDRRRRANRRHEPTGGSDAATRT